MQRERIGYFPSTTVKISGKKKGVLQLLKIKDPNVFDLTYVKLYPNFCKH